VHTLIDTLVRDRVLVFGSLPPRGRDLDLLARPPEETAIAAGLARSGFVRKGRTWARFAGCAAEVVEVVRATDWNLPPAETAALFAEAKPVDGAVHVVRPAPHHVLLIAARRLGGGPIRLDAKQRARLDAALAEDRGAWVEARRRATAWGADGQVAALESAYRRDGAAPHSPARAAGRRVAAMVRRRGALITFSGLDGAGKSFQAEQLRRALGSLGYEPVVVWTSVASRSEPLILVKDAANAFLSRLRASPVSAEPDPARALRRRSGPVAFAWTALVALAAGLRQRRSTWRHLRRGRAVICDRWTLDSVVMLRFLYGDAISYRFHERLIRALSPRPVRSYLLDVSPEVASSRKPEYDVAENARRAVDYRSLSTPLGVVRLDAERPPDELCAAIAEDVWRSLG